MKKAKKRRREGRTLAAAAVLAACLPVQATAAPPATQIIVSAAGRETFAMLFYAKGDGPKDNPASVCTPSATERQGIARGWKIWADVLGTGSASHQIPFVDVVMVSERGNAHCGSALSASGSGMTMLGEAIIKGCPPGAAPSWIWAQACQQAPHSRSCIHPARANLQHVRARNRARARHFL